MLKFFSLVHFLLDEILGSAVHRCLEPVLMEPSVVDIICERELKHFSNM